MLMCICYKHKFQDFQVIIFVLSRCPALSYRPVKFSLKLMVVAGVSPFPRCSEPSPGTFYKTPEINTKVSREWECLQLKSNLFHRSCCFGVWSEKHRQVNIVSLYDQLPFEQVSILQPNVMAAITLFFNSLSSPLSAVSLRCVSWILMLVNHSSQYLE